MRQTIKCVERKYKVWFYKFDIKISHVWNWPIIFLPHTCFVCFWNEGYSTSLIQWIGGNNPTFTVLLVCERLKLSMPLMFGSNHS